jgi:hypothetical protein
LIQKNIPTSVPVGPRRNDRLYPQTKGRIKENLNFPAKLRAEVDGLLHPEQNNLNAICWQPVMLQMKLVNVNHISATANPATQLNLTPSGMLTSPGAAPTEHGFLKITLRPINHGSILSRDLISLK